jgi:peptide/nickel transport system substrate-binding protein
LKRALIGKPENLHPFNGFKDVSEMISICTPELAKMKIGCYETMIPNLACKIESRDREDQSGLQEYWVHLRGDIFWEPLNSAHFPDTLELAPHFLKRHPVTAHDFKFFYDAVMNSYLHESKAASLRTYYGDIEQIRVVDDKTFVVRWKLHSTLDGDGKSIQKVKYTSFGLTCSLQPLPCFVYQYFADGQKIIEPDTDPDIYRKNSVWAQNFSQHWAKNIIVSCGPYIFDGMTDEGISFKRNPHFFNPYAALIDGIKYLFKESFDAVWQDFKAGKIDLCTLSPNQLMELHTFLKSDEYKIQKENHQAIQHLDFIDMSYYYIGWNVAKPFFANEKVRRAMTLAIDRRRIIEQNLNLMAVAISGPFFLSSSATDPTISPYPYHPEEARRLLEEAGWVDLDGDGVRDKIIDGQKVPFRFKLYYFVKSLSTKVIAEYVTTALRSIGIHCELCGLDIADLSRQFEDKTFDAIFMGWKLGSPPEDPRQLWHSSGAKEKGSSNAIGFQNERIDTLIELLNYEYDKGARIKLYHQFHQIIHKEAPYTFLYTPKVRLLYREYVHNIFIPNEHQDLIPGADVGEPHTYSLWLTK